MIVVDLTGEMPVVRFDGTRVYYTTVAATSGMLTIATPIKGKYWVVDTIIGTKVAVLQINQSTSWAPVRIMTHMMPHLA